MYWVFVCNPQKWAIDRFLQQNIEHDTWGVRPSDAERFAPGQLGIIRVGTDRRSVKELNENPRLEAGIYALCEVESAAVEGTGASDKYWSIGSARARGWPTVKLRYLRNYRTQPVTIKRLRTERPNVSKLLLNGFQAASFPISEQDFCSIMELLREDLSNLPRSVEETTVSPTNLSDLEDRYLSASPVVKLRLSRSIERGSVGDHVKKANGFKCQICEASNLESLGFVKKNGERYVEAHHVTPVSAMEVGSLAASNVISNRSGSMT
jgi:predicted RNA-binding protein with PUA-like domain